MCMYVCFLIGNSLKQLKTYLFLLKYLDFLILYPKLGRFIFSFSFPVSCFFSCFFYGRYYDVFRRHSNNEEMFFIIFIKH